MTVKTPRQLYKKLLYICSAVIVGVVLILMIYFISSTKLRIAENNREYVRMLSEDAANYIKDASDNVDYIVTDLYRTTTELEDLIHYFQDDEETYLKYRLGRYIDSGLLDYTGTDDFVENIFDANATVKKVTLMGNEQDWTTTYFRNQRVLRGKNKAEIMKHIQKHNSLRKRASFRF